MRIVVLVRPLAVACLLGLPLAACVSGPANPSAARAAELATVISRAGACDAGAPGRRTLDQFLASEQARGVDPAQIAGARSTYLTVSEAATLNAIAQPKACTPQERAELRARMARIRAGAFDGV